MFLKATYDLKPKITITNSPLFTKSDRQKLRDDSVRRKKIELEYKQTVTRSLDDEELSRRVPDNLVDKILATYHKKAAKSTRKSALVKSSEFNSASFCVENRHKMVHSAPTARNHIHLQAKAFSDRAEHSQYTFRSAQSSNTYLKRVSKPKESDAQKKIKWNFKHEQNELKTQSKSIMRSQRPIVAKSMNVEKWIGIHRRRSANAMLNLASQTDSVSQDEDFFDKYEFLSEPKQKKSRSIRELSELTMLDKVQERIRRDINEKIKNLRKIESKNEFNAIVNRIKAFLDELENPLETSSFVSSVSTLRNEKITLYELALA
ncbi:hypothetical protein BpHYR1_011930 [Brachionus plicatilis]|uniref:Uncharacterized protein n=1 Tax=Brachionus plicatilis TaxID=10195 RepID=A0A3M7SMI3_BRAPC|nr:hypothetical protein BpHYR1_011930 [Brachionus plicatilis]